jgi:hypothetical protein
MSFTTTHRNGFTTARCDSPRCTAEVQWRGPADSPPVGARNALRGHVCPNWRHGQVAQEGGSA